MLSCLYKGRQVNTSFPMYLFLLPYYKNIQCELKYVHKIINIIATITSSQVNIITCHITKGIVIVGNNKTDTLMKFATQLEFICPYSKDDVVPCNIFRDCSAAT